MTNDDLKHVRRGFDALMVQINASVGALSAAKAFAPQFQLLLMVTLVDLLGYVSVGSSVQANAVAFVRDYLGRRNRRYQEVGGLLYYMIRHGLVHEQKWKSVRLTDGSELTVRVGKGSLHTHLGIDYGAAHTPWENTLWLNVNTDELWKDIKIGVADFLDDLAHDQHKLQTCIETIDHLVAAEPESIVAKRCAYTRPDFAHLKKEGPNRRLHSDARKSGARR